MGTLWEVEGTLGSIIEVLPTIENIITPPELTATADDYDPTEGLIVFSTSNVTMVRQRIDANNREITGLVAPAAGVNRIVYINNLWVSGGTDDIKFMENDSGSTAANRFLLRDNADKSIKPNETAGFWYDHTSARWRPITRVG